MNCYTIYNNRYVYFCIYFFILFFISNDLKSHPQDYKKFKVIEMEILKDEKVIGYCNYFFDFKNQILTVKNETKFEVRLLGIKVFSINSKSYEKYKKNNLISYNSETFQNEKRKFVNLKFDENKKKFNILGSSYKGIGELDSIIGHWWNHDILQTDSQISPLSGSIKKQTVNFIKKEIISINNKEYKTEHYKLRSKDPNTPDDKKLNFDIWYSKRENLILKIVYNKMGIWEYNVINFEKN